MYNVNINIQKLKNTQLKKPSYLIVKEPKYWEINIKQKKKTKQTWTKSRKSIMIVRKNIILLLKGSELIFILNDNGLGKGFEEFFHENEIAVWPAIIDGGLWAKSVAPNPTTTILFQ